MWKIGVGYALLLIWCYLRAELHYRRTAHAAASGAAGPAAGIGVRLRALAWVVLVAAVVLVVWGSGFWCILWFPTGLLVAGFVQTLLPLRNRWK